MKAGGEADLDPFVADVKLHSLSRQGTTILGLDGGLQSIKPVLGK